jgi:hypothetical protein
MSAYTAAIVLFLIWLTIIAGLLCRVLGYNHVRCEFCGLKLRQREAFEHGGDPCVYTHQGPCCDGYSKVHAEHYYAA